MTYRVTIGVDPGLSGALAVLADGDPADIVDMPTRTVGEWREIDAISLTALLRGYRGRYVGADFSACLEKVGARPGDGGTSLFRFGEGAGAIRGVLESLGIRYSRAIPAVWKRRFGLLGTEKDAARELAIRRFPSVAHLLQRKKDQGRADALLLALFHEHAHLVVGGVA